MTIFLRDSNGTEPFLIDAYIARASVEKIENWATMISTYSSASNK